MSALNQIVSRVFGGGRRRGGPTGPTGMGTGPTGMGTGGTGGTGAASASRDAALGRGLRSLFRRVR